MIVIRHAAAGSPLYLSRILPIVVFSSSNLPDDISRAYGLGANSYVVKPTDPERLERMVKALREWWTEFNLTGPTL